jgi:hypothetical protein
MIIMAQFALSSAIVIKTPRNIHYSRNLVTDRGPFVRFEAKPPNDPHLMDLPRERLELNALYAMKDGRDGLSRVANAIISGEPFFRVPVYAEGGGLEPLFLSIRWDPAGPIVTSVTSKLGAGAIIGGKAEWSNLFDDSGVIDQTKLKVLRS